MKKYRSIIFVALMIIAITVSCKKSTSKDYTISIKDKTWCGALAYTGKTAEYYSVHFNADNSLIWNQLVGPTPGKWILNGKQLTMTFTGNSVQIKADITDDDKLMNITDNTPASEIISGELVINPNIPLDNTIWKGNYTGSPIFQLSFMPGLKVQIKIGSTEYLPAPYSRSAAGEVILVTAIPGSTFFGVITAANEMKGSFGDAEHSWQAIKQ